ncbi:MAG: hypothetical protein KKA19_08280 [Candidatus Margulisbacteria bacterium]|nr:hypothetical protein [Candidatus Margulisiibacteriota bacterium]
MSENTCNICKAQITDNKDSYLLNRKGERVCKACGDHLINQANAKEPGKIKLIELKNGEKILALANKK